MNIPRFSICTTNYNCTQALKQHLDSISSVLNEDEFEYIIGDSKSGDGSMKILKEHEKKHDNMVVISEKCSIGRERQITFKHSKGDPLGRSRWQKMWSKY